MPAVAAEEVSAFQVAPRPVSIATVSDNYAVGEGFGTAWGHASVVSTPDEKVLFDTGSDGGILLANMRTMGIEPRAIARVVISHEHRDHLGGLDDFLRVNGDVVVYILPSFPGRVRRNITSAGARYEDIERPTEVAAWLYTTGPMPGPPSEQSLVVASPEGLVVMTGCAHPGIVAIVGRVRTVFPDQTIALVMGGFHLAGASEAEVDRIIRTFEHHGVERVAPSHCTGDRARDRFRAAYGDGYVAGGAGRTIVLG